MSDVKWIKLSSDLFDNRKIKQIRKIPDGDAIIVIWFQILCLAGNQGSNGLVYFSNDIPYTDEMLAIEFDRNIGIIRLALNTFIKFGMLEIVNDFILISNWEKYQSANKIESIREYNNEKKREQRKRQKLLALEICQGHSQGHSQGQVIDCQGTDIISISNNLNSLSSSLSIKDNKYKDVVNYLNEKSGKNFRVSIQTKKLIDARLNESFLIDDFYRVIDNQCEKWLSDEKMIDYIRPQTLFGNKFESYLNTIKKKNKTGSRFLDLIEEEME